MSVAKPIRTTAWALPLALGCVSLVAAQAQPPAKGAQKPAPAPAKSAPAPAAKAPAKSPAPAPASAQKQAAPSKQAPAKSAAAKVAPAKPKSAAKAPGKSKAPAKAPAEKAAESAPSRRDPFSPLVAQRGSGAEIPTSGLPAGIAGLVIGNLNINGIVRAPNGMIAVVSNPQRRVYFLREGARLFNGTVERITMDSVSFREQGKDAFGKPVERQLTKRLYPSAGEQP